MTIPKTHLLDRRPWWVGALVFVGYLLSWVICLGVGAGGPSLSTQLPVVLKTSNFNCANPMNCTVSMSTQFTGLTGLSQALWFVGRLRRPVDAVTGQPVLLPLTLNIPVDYIVTSSGTTDDGTVVELESGVLKSAVLNCRANDPECGIMVLFAQSFLHYPTYTVSVSVLNPWAGFVQMAGVPASNIDTGLPVTMRFTCGSVNPDFTKFQINTKYTFFGLSLLMLAIYMWAGFKGKGSRDPRNKALVLKDTVEQRWLLVLGAWLPWANDPFAAISLRTANFAASGFYAFCAITFLCILLLHWLVEFDHSANGQWYSASHIDARRGRPLGASARIARRCHCGAIGAAACFWLPKLLWIIVTWVLLLSFYLVQRSAAVADPVSNILSQYPSIRTYFMNFAITWAAVYVIYLLVLIVMGIYNCRGMRPAARFVLGITIVTMLSVLAGYFANGWLVTVNTTDSSLLFMAATGAANLYVYFLVRFTTHHVASYSAVLHGVFCFLSFVGWPAHWPHILAAHPPPAICFVLLPSCH